MEKQVEKSITIRITAEELQLLKHLAKKEFRTKTSWLRSRIMIEAEKKGVIKTIESTVPVAEPKSQRDKSTEERKCVSQEDWVYDEPAA